MNIRRRGKLVKAPGNYNVVGMSAGGRRIYALAIFYICLKDQTTAAMQIVCTRFVDLESVEIVEGP